MQDLWDVRRVAAYLGLSERSVYDKARGGDLPAVRVGGRWRFRPEDLDAWITERAAGAVAAEARTPDRSELERQLAGVDDPVERRLRFVAVLSDACLARGWSAPVIVGGNAVEFYTAGGYATMDIDLVSESEPLDAILGEWGFGKEGRHWFDEALGIAVECPSAQLAGDPHRVMRVAVGGREASIIGVEDLLIDRLNACVHWDSQEDCGWARILYESYRETLDLEYVRRRAVQEDLSDALERTAGGD